MQLIDENDVLRIVDQLAHDLFQALFELAAIFRAGHNQTNVERKNALVFEERRNFTAHDALRQTFDDGSLADAWFADENRIVLSAATKDLNHALDFIVSSNQRIEPIVGSVFCQVARELEQVWNIFAMPRVGAALSRNLVANSSEPQSSLKQDLRRHRTLFTQKSQQQMLGANVTMLQTIGFFV